jgi:hypothetical protein
MQSIEISVKQADLPEILNTMREWLDRERCNLWHFRHASDGTGFIVINAGFAAGDVCAEAFRQRFGGTASSA